MLTINQLMKYLRNHHSISVKSNQAQSLRNIGYYHGYKGYRFIRNPNSRIPFSSLDEVIGVQIVTETVTDSGGIPKRRNLIQIQFFSRGEHHSYVLLI